MINLIDMVFMQNLQKSTDSFIVSMPHFYDKMVLLLLLTDPKKC